MRVCMKIYHKTGYEHLYRERIQFKLEHKHHFEEGQLSSFFRRTVVSYWQTTGHLVHFMQFKCLHKMHIMQRCICVCM